MPLRNEIIVQNFEKKLFRQAAYWTSGLTIELVKKQVKLDLVENPDTMEIDGWLWFKGSANLIASFYVF